MSEYISKGPVRTLPGHVRRGNFNCKCDDCDVPATIRVQGETDSFGCEYYYQCEACYAEDQKQDDAVSICEHCDTESVLAPCRDPGEGLTGPVYWLCQPCKKKLHND